MSSRKLFRSLNVRSPSGAIASKVSEISHELKAASPQGLCAVTDDEIVDAALNILSRRIVREGVMVAPKDIGNYCALRFSDLQHEVFSCIFVDQQSRIIALEELFRGTLGMAYASPREIVKRALVHNAAAVLLVHNHPSGNPSPSNEDRKITCEIVAALELFGVRVLDHIVVGGGKYFSMSAGGAP